MADDSRKLTIRQRYRRLTPWNKLAAWGSLASMVAVPLAFYFYFSSLRSREMAWAIAPLRTIIFDP